MKRVRWSAATFYLLLLTLFLQGNQTSLAQNARETPQQSRGGRGRPVISALIPSFGPVGTQVRVIGDGFTPTQNRINFGLGVLLNNSSADGKEISFQVPAFLTPACRFTRPACLLPTFPLVPGLYRVSVTNSRGMSNAAVFTVTRDQAER